MSLFRSLVWNDAITAFHRVISTDSAGKTVTNWQRFQLVDCFYGLKARQRVAGLEIISANVHITRIPSSSIPDGFAISKSDIIVKGHVTDELAQNDSGANLRATYAGLCFVVNSCGDNRDLRATAHIVASED